MYFFALVAVVLCGWLLRFFLLFAVNAVGVRLFVVIHTFLLSTYIYIICMLHFLQVINGFMRQLKNVVDDSSSTKMLQLWQHQVTVPFWGQHTWN